MAERQQYLLISQALPRALFVFFKILLYFVVLPYKVWKASIIRLADISNKPLLRDEEEFPVYAIFKIAYDTVILILPILGVVFMVGSFLGFHYGYNSFVYFLSSIFFEDILYVFIFLGDFFYLYLNNFLYLGDFFYFLTSGITIFLVYYFMIPFVSFIKEILTFPLSFVHNLEKIDKNTRDL
tara:strand:- start:1866 stop:2411 length:546 start_codon:yes stop_codon:yes gene_type:complete